MKFFTMSRIEIRKEERKRAFKVEFMDVELTQIMTCFRAILRNLNFVP